MEIEPLRRETLGEAVVERIRQMIEQGRLQPGARLPSERELCERFGVSRTAVREGLRALSTVGLLEIRPGDGIYVGRRTGDFFVKPLTWGLLLNRQHILELFQTRQIVEVALAGMAAETASLEQKMRLRERLDAMREARHDPEAFAAADFAFHMVIAEAAGNSVLVSLLNSVSTLLMPQARINAGREGTADRALAKHEVILEAILSGTASAARTAMQEHLRLTEARMLELADAEKSQAEPPQGG